MQSVDVLLIFILCILVHFMCMQRITTTFLCYNAYFSELNLVIRRNNRVSPLNNILSSAKLTGDENLR